MPIQILGGLRATLAPPPSPALAIEGDAEMNRSVVALGVFVCLVSAPLVASAQDRSGECELEDWRYWHSDVMSSLAVEGSVTCESGKIVLRLYGGTEENKTFLGVADAYIDGYAFTALASDIETPPDNLFLKYSITDD